MSNHSSNSKLSLTQEEKENEEPECDKREESCKSRTKSFGEVSSKVEEDGKNMPRKPQGSPTAHRSNTTGERINGSLYPPVVIEDLGDSDSPDLSTSVSRIMDQTRTVSKNANAGRTTTASNHNNNSLAVIPAKPNQMIPIALLRKQPNNVSADDNTGSAGTGLMQIITAKNKVAPAECSAEALGLPTPTTTVGAVLMLIPKKSDSVCVDIPPPDLENNPVLENRTQSVDNNCQSAGSTHQQDVVVKAANSYDSYEEVCRICHDNPSKLELISPCLCKGSMSKVHRSCLERWLAESAKNSCEICNYEYNTVRKPKYRGCRSLYQWIRHPLSPSDMRNLFFDIACFFILTPLAAISSWLCVVGAQHYTIGEEKRQKTKIRNDASPLWDVHGHDSRGDASNATWTSVGLLSLTGTLLVAYSVWLFVAIKYHIQAWKEWQQRNYTVTIVPFEDGCMGRPPPPRPPRDQTNNNDSLLRGSENNLYNFDFDTNPNPLRYSGHNSLMRGQGGRNIFRQNRRPRSYNLPPIFNRSHFLRNPPPGYTISETTLLYQALYGSDSDAFLNENFLAFFADSSDDVTESSSQVAPELPNSSRIPGSQKQAGSQEQPQNLSEIPVVASANENVDKDGGHKSHTTVNIELPGGSTNLNNNLLISSGNVSLSVNGSTNEKAKSTKSSGNVANNHLVLRISCNDENNENNQNELDKI